LDEEKRDSRAVFVLVSNVTNRIVSLPCAQISGDGLCIPIATPAQSKKPNRGKEVQKSVGPETYGNGVSMGASYCASKGLEKLENALRDSDLILARLSKTKPTMVRARLAPEYMAIYSRVSIYSSSFRVWPIRQKVYIF
jgi:hypothetical protein